MDRHVLSLECSGADPGGIQEAPTYDFAKSIAKSIFFQFHAVFGKTCQNNKLVPSVLGLASPIRESWISTNCWVVGLCLLMKI